MGFLNSFALKRMAKDALVRWFKQCGIGRPPAAAIVAIEDAASALDSGSEVNLRRALDRYAASVGNIDTLVLTGPEIIQYFGREFPQYEWAIECTREWYFDHE